MLLAGTVYYYANYEDVVVTSGSKFGLTIGDSKRATYRKLLTSLSSMDSGVASAYVYTTSDAQLAPVLGVEPGDRALTQTYFDQSGFGRFESENNWDIYIEASMLNSLRLMFCDEQLCKIHRHKAVFEVP